MPRYVVQRTFPDGLLTRVGDGGSELCQTVVEPNAEEGVTWVHSYVSAEKRTTVLHLRRANSGGDPQDRRTERAPVDQISQVRVLDPYFYS